MQWLGLDAYSNKGVCSISFQGTKILQASWQGQINQSANK